MCGVCVFVVCVMTTIPIQQTHRTNVCSVMRGFWFYDYDCDVGLFVQVCDLCILCSKSYNLLELDSMQCSRIGGQYDV